MALTCLTVLALTGCQGDLNRTLSQVVWDGHPFKTTGWIEGISIPYTSNGAAPIVFIQRGGLFKDPRDIAADSPFCAFRFDQFEWRRPALMNSMNIDSIPLTEKHAGLGGAQSQMDISIYKAHHEYHISINTPYDLPRSISDFATDVTIKSEFKCYVLSHSGVKTEMTDSMSLNDFQDLMNFNYSWVAPGV